jgi:hypothetical protein
MHRRRDGDPLRVLPDHSPVTDDLAGFLMAAICYAFGSRETFAISWLSKGSELKTHPIISGR